MASEGRDICTLITLQAFGADMSSLYACCMTSP